MQVVVPRILAPKTLTRAIKPKTYLIQDKVFEKDPPKLLVAAGTGGVPPSGNDLPSPFKKPFSKETLEKIRLFTKDMNKFTRKGYDILNKYSKTIK